MIKLSELIGTKDITLPESGATVTVVDKIAHGKAQDIRDAVKDEDSKSRIGAIAAANIILDWNIFLDNGEKAPINEETLRQMPNRDVDTISSYAIDLMLEEKKEPVITNPELEPVIESVPEDTEAQPAE